MQIEKVYSENNRIMYFYEKNADRLQKELSFLQFQGWIKLYDTHFQIFFHPRLHHVICEYDAEQKKSYSYALMSIITHTIHWASICRGGLPIHGCLIEHHGKGIILAGRSGVGKSTSSRRVSFPWQARCDDEILVVSAPGGRYLAHPFPTWMDYLSGRAENTWKVENAVPLAGLFFLEQSPKDEFSPLGGAEAAVAATNSAAQIMLFHCLCNSKPGQVRELRRTVFNNACELVTKVPAFRLRVSLTGRFWEQIESALNLS